MFGSAPNRGAGFVPILFHHKGTTRFVTETGR